MLPGIGMSTPYRRPMRELRLVAGGADSEHLVVETIDGTERFTLRVEEMRRHLLAPAGPPPEPAPTPDPAAAPPAASSIPPREIQMRVRAGEAPNAVADEAGVSIDRVLLFAGPVLDERSRMAGEARRARARRSTPEAQLVVFGEAVDERFAAHGIDPASVRWDSHRREDGQWIVSAGWRGGESERTAQWSFSLASRSVTPQDETASDLLSDRPIRPVVSAVPDLPARRNSTPDALTGPLPLMVDRPAAGDEDLFDRAPPADDESPPLPLHVVAETHVVPETHVVAETEEQKAARARVPSWDDILLGVRRKRD